MALFQKKPQTSSTAQLYTLGLQQTRLIIGLGNVGKKYDLTRHNIGFACVEHLAKALDLPNWIEKKDLKCQVSIGKAGNKQIILVKPTTYMNNSGESVQAVSHFYKVTPQDILVIHDELDIPFGQIRTRNGGSSAGHNGVKSIIQHLGEDFGRIRIGVGSNTTVDSADYVLSKFSSDEQTQLPNLKREVSAISTEYIYGTSLISETRSFI